MTVFVNEHEYLKMVRAREDRIRTFMQLELEACLKEVRWSITCYNCEVLGCPQEETRRGCCLPSPPDYEVNLTNRLRAAQKGILPASLRMILNSEYSQSVLRYGITSPSAARQCYRGTSGGTSQHGVRVRFIAATRRGRYEIRETRNAAKVARDQYGTR